jgi:hypothetical protein
MRYWGGRYMFLCDRCGRLTSRLISTQVAVLDSSMKQWKSLRISIINGRSSIRSFLCPPCVYRTAKRSWHPRGMFGAKRVRSSRNCTPKTILRETWSDPKLTATLAMRCKRGLETQCLACVHVLFRTCYKPIREAQSNHAWFSRFFGGKTFRQNFWCAGLFVFA